MKRFALILLFLLTVLRLSAQTTPYHYTIQANIPTQLIYCLGQDQYGRLLIGTDKGLYRYNGFRSKRISSKGIASKEIVQLVKYGNTYLAANAAGQLFELKGDRLLAVALSNFQGDIKHLEVASGKLTITGSKHITTYSLPEFKLLGQEAIPFTETEGTLANYVLEYKGIHYAVLNSGELVEIEEGASRNIPNATGKVLVAFGDQFVIVPSFLANDPVYSYANGRFRNWGTLQPRGNFRVNGAKVIGNKLYVLSENGVFVYTNALSKRPAHWFAGTAATDVFNDSQGNTWIATKGKGLLFIPSGRHEIVYTSTLLSIENGPKGTFFGGRLDGSIVQFDSRGRELRSYTSAINNQEALYMYYDGSVQQLFSNTGQFSTRSGLALNRVSEAIKGVARLSDGSLYLAKSSGVVFIPALSATASAYGMTDSTSFELLRKEPARSIVLNTATQEVAFSTVSGVFLRKGREAAKEVTFNGQPIDAQAIAWFRNDLIVATSAHELLLVHNGRVTKRKDMSINSGELVVLKMLTTYNHVYILTEKGMYRFKNLDESMEGLKELMGFDGLVMRDFTIVDDKLYVVTQRGVLRFTWSQDSKPGYSLVLGEISGRKYKTYAIKDERIQIPYDEKLIVIPFECVDLSGNRQFTVRYAIHTDDERGYWNSLPADAEQLNLSHLNPDNYTIEFYLYDPVSQTKGPVQRHRFTVLYEWYNRPFLWWFIAVFFAFWIGWTWRWSVLRERKRGVRG